MDPCELWGRVEKLVCGILFLSQLEVIFELNTLAHSFLDEFELRFVQTVSDLVLLFQFLLNQIFERNRRVEQTSKLKF